MAKHMLEFAIASLAFFLPLQPMSDSEFVNKSVIKSEFTRVGSTRDFSISIDKSSVKSSWGPKQQIIQEVDMDLMFVPRREMYVTDENVTKQITHFVNSVTFNCTNSTSTINAVKMWNHSSLVNISERVGPLSEWMNLGPNFAAAIWEVVCETPKPLKAPLMI